MPCVYIYNNNDHCLYHSSELPGRCGRLSLEKTGPSDSRNSLLTFFHTLGFLEDDEPRPAALDGKSLCGTWNRWDRVVHLLNVDDQRTKAAIHQRLVSGDTSEYQVALELFKDLLLTGRDERGLLFAEGIPDLPRTGGGYLLPVKDNQPQPVSAISSKFMAQDTVLSS